MQKVVVFGQGYVGLPLAMLAVESGFQVVGFEVDPTRLAALESGESYVEDVPSSQVRQALDSGHFLPTSNESMLKNFDYAVIAVPTPLKDGVPDTSFIEGSGRTIGAFLTIGATVILESTTYPGTTEEVLAPLLEAASGLTCGVDFQLGYSPERIDPGNPVWNLRSTPKVVSGVDSHSLELICHFYETLAISVVKVAGTKEAELAKLLENTFRHVNIALINELSIHAHGLGINIWEVIRAASTKPFGFMPFLPGPGVGGHCLPVDPSFLTWKTRRDLGIIPRFIETANDINSQMPSYVVQRFVRGLNLAGIAMARARVLIIGLAYKKNSSDSRESPAIPIVSLLRDYGAEILVHDDNVPAGSAALDVERVALDPSILSTVDGILLVTDHDDVDYDLVSRSRKYILDTRNRLSADVAEQL